MIQDRLKEIVFILVFLFLQFSAHAINKKQVPDPLCGPKSLLKICEIRKVSSNLQELCDLTGYNENTGTSMLGLYQAADKLGMPVIPVRIDTEKLLNINEPLIAFVDGNHFLVVYGCKGDKVLIQNPPDIPFFQSKKIFESRWNGEVLVFSEKLKKQMKSQVATLSGHLEEPRIWFNRTYHDFKTVDEGEKLTYSFVFTNIGNEILEVNARSTCTCTVALLSNKRIPPGGKGKVKLEFNTKGKKGIAKQSVHVKTNDPSNKYVTLAISATIKPSIKVIPEKIWLDEVAIGEEITREIFVIDSGDRTLKIQKVETPEGILSRVLPEKSGDIRKIPIHLTISSESNPGNFEKKITIYTNDLNRSKIIVPIKGIVLPEVRACPPAFFFGEIMQDTTVVREVIVSSTNEKNLRQIKVKHSSPFVKIKIITSDDESKYKIQAILQVSSSNTTIRDKITIYIEDKNNPAVEIPLYARVISKINKEYDYDRYEQ